MRPVPVSAIASSTLAVPSMLTWWLAHAQCATTSAPVTARLTAARVADVGCDEISRTRPAFRSMTGDSGDVVALAEQSGDEAAAEYPAGPGDRDPQAHG